MRKALVLVAAFAMVLAAAAPVSAAGGSSGDRAKTYYLSLGDSLAASVQPIGDPADLYRTNQGYAEQLLQTAKSRYPKLALEKLGCPGETTTTFIDGGICDYSHGSQLDEAIAFLQGHREFVAFITIDLGANDFNCAGGYCIEQGVASIQANLPGIVADLRAAAGPDIPIVGMTLYNPFLANWLTGPEGQQIAIASATQLMGPVNFVIRSIFESGGALVADVEAEFSSNDFATQVDLGGGLVVPLNVARICMWTWVCTPYQDNHANVDGYAALARAFAVQLGL
jgi:lysophospholipase L1-like esterase